MRVLNNLNYKMRTPSILDLAKMKRDLEIITKIYTILIAHFLNII